MKKPSLKGLNNIGYLGHFSQDKYIQDGHNTSGTIILGSGVGYNKDEERVDTAGEAFPGDAMKEALTNEGIQSWAGKKKKKYVEKLSKKEQKLKAAQEAVFKKK